MWVIYHIEKNFGLKKSIQIEKDKAFEEINRQLEKKQFHELEDLKTFTDIYTLYKGRLDYIFTYVQHKLGYNKYNGSLNKNT